MLLPIRIPVSYIYIKCVALTLDTKRRKEQPGRLLGRVSSIATPSHDSILAKLFVALSVIAFKFNFNNGQFKIRAQHYVQCNIPFSQSEILFLSLPAGHSCRESAFKRPSRTWAYNYWSCVCMRKKAESVNRGLGVSTWSFIIICINTMQ